jgi:hypothetical protein
LGEIESVTKMDQTRPEPAEKRLRALSYPPLNFVFLAARPARSSKIFLRLRFRASENATETAWMRGTMNNGSLDALVVGNSRATDPSVCED